MIPVTLMNGFGESKESFEEMLFQYVDFNFSEGKPRKSKLKLRLENYISWSFNKSGSRHVFLIKQITYDYRKS